jgi:hypothetical protein
MSANVCSLCGGSRAAHGDTAVDHSFMSALGDGTYRLTRDIENPNVKLPSLAFRRLATWPKGTVFVVQSQSRSMEAVGAYLGRFYRSEPEFGLIAESLEPAHEAPSDWIRRNSNQTKLNELVTWKRATLVLNKLFAMGTLTMADIQDANAACESDLKEEETNAES